MKLDVGVSATLKRTAPTEFAAAQMPAKTIRSSSAAPGAGVKRPCAELLDRLDQLTFAEPVPTVKTCTPAAEEFGKTFGCATCADPSRSGYHHSVACNKRRELFLANQRRIDIPAEQPRMWGYARSAAAPRDTQASDKHLAATAKEVAGGAWLSTRHRPQASPQVTASSENGPFPVAAIRAPAKLSVPAVEQCPPVSAPEPAPALSVEKASEAPPAGAGRPASSRILPWRNSSMTGVSAFPSNARGEAVRNVEIEMHSHAAMASAQAPAQALAQAPAQAPGEVPAPPPAQPPPAQAPPAQAPAPAPAHAQSSAQSSGAQASAQFSGAQASGQDQAFRMDHDAMQTLEARNRGLEEENRRLRQLLTSHQQVAAVAEEVVTPQVHTESSGGADKPLGAKVPFQAQEPVLAHIQSASRPQEKDAEPYDDWLALLEDDM
eukprot:gnl/TRDRNA2_/TRDRNA2_167978_c3_seq1.p1 gnl/TRDRNA2_/TRDRNA2_167978_c3~~gnl/TRDRNA2_/TRDRNA2_167978_c3_seq1.p1  ORF type:complete len:447 (+),score=75.50 gnl/TRDRNA2_/TRDRNA2_167978_c3_seq1:38-1342(+)